MEMPHPAGFLGRHMKEAAGYEDARCARCHQLAECDGCHIAHVHPGGTEGDLKGAKLPSVEASGQ
jgi:hypothetical protein